MLSAKRGAQLPGHPQSPVAVLLAFVALFGLVLVADCRSPITAAASPTPSNASPGTVKRESGPAPGPQTIAKSPSAAASPPAGNTTTKSVSKIPIGNIVLDPLPATAIGDTVVAVLKWSNTSDKSIGNNWNLCSASSIFDNTTAALACKHYGYPAGGYRIADAASLLSEQPYLVSLPLFNCPRSVTSFEECTSGDLIKSAACPISDLIAVKCFGEGSLRLVNGTTIREGRLQMFWDGSWNNVCSSNIADGTAKKVCDLLGFPNSFAIRWSSANYDQGNRRFSEPHVWVPYVSCDGSETSFKSCFSDSAPYKLADGGSKCYSSDSDAALVCTEPAAAPVPASPTSAAAAPVAAPAKKSSAHAGVSAAGGALYLVMLLAVLQVLVC